MYNIKSRYEKIATKHPEYSTYTTYAETVRDTNLSEGTVRRWFRKLVDRDDYAQSEAQAVLRHLVQITKRSPAKTSSGTT